MGPEVGAVATLAGFPPDPEQQLLLDAAFALDKDGKSVAFEVVVIAPRQNLKTGFFKQAALGQLFVRDERLVVWSAHEFDTSQEALTDIEGLLDGSDMLRRRVKRIIHGAVPAIEMVNGSRLKFKTRTSGAGRGLSGRKVFLDEAYALQPGQIGALLPIMLAQPDPQVFIGSSACRPESAALWEYVQRGRAGGGPRMVYAEWCAPPPSVACDDGDECDHARGRVGCGCDKPELIRKVHTAITRGRILMQTVVDLRSMPPAEYGREIMGWHDEPLLSAIPLVGWAARGDVSAAPGDPPLFGLDASPNLASAAIVACGPHTDNLPVIEVVAHQAGTAWIIPWLSERKDKYKPLTVAIDPSGPIGALQTELEQLGINLVLLDAKQASQACATVVSAVVTGQMWHQDDTRLNEAVAVAAKRPAADSWRWSRKNSPVDISPLVAATNALWLHTSAAANNYDPLDSFF